MSDRLNKIAIGTNTYELEDIDRDSFQRVGSMVCYNTSTSDTAGKWTVNIPNITALYEGLTIKIRLKTSYSTTNTLNVNGLGAKTIYWRYGSKLTSHYAKESMLMLTYTTDAISSGTDRTGWIIESIYDSSDNYTLRDYYTQYYPVTTLYRYQVCFINSDNKLVPANSINNSTATDKTLTTETFDINKDIYFYNTTANVATTSRNAAATLYRQTLADLRYSFNTGNTLVAYKPVYLVVTPKEGGEDGEVTLASNPIQQTIPTGDTDDIYVFLGLAYDKYRVSLTIDHPKYTVVNGKVVSWPLIKNLSYPIMPELATNYAFLPKFGGQITLGNGDLLTLSYSTEDRNMGDFIITGSDSLAISLNNGADNAWIALTDTSDSATILMHSYRGVLFDFNPRLQNDSIMKIYVYKYSDYSDVSGGVDADTIRSRLGNPVCEIALHRNGLYWTIHW